MNRDEWTALAARCESTAGPDRDIERCMCRLIPDGFQMVPFSEFTASLDAITALIARELPDYAWLRKGETYMTVYRRPADDKTWARHIDAPGATPALALCAAFCRAKADP
jgi:hypothetical protein